VLGRPGVLLLTPGNASDVTTAPAVLAEAPGRIRRLAADNADSDGSRPPIPTRSRPAFRFDVGHHSEMKPATR
jgi:hypothetical protein